jgi:excisionase family DNA binding protein
MNDTKLPEVMDLRALRRYVTVSDSTLRNWIAELTDPLPAYKVGTKLYVRRAAFDAWFERHRLRVQDLGQVVENLAAELR